MRRLHQAVLAVLAVISFLGFLLYKHEYDRVSNILHVLNTFGSSSASGCDSSAKEALLSRMSSSSNWQQIGDFYIYSAFWESNSVKLLGVVPVSLSLKALSSNQCLMWHETSDNRQEYELGNLRVEVAEEQKEASYDDYWKVISLTCRPNVDKVKAPYGVSVLLASQVDADKNTLPVIKVNNVFPQSVNSNNVTLAICATVRSPEVEDSFITQFIKFHSYVGVNTFLLYDLGIAPSIQRLLHKLAVELPHLNIQLLSWNFPMKATTKKSKLSTNLIKLDCLKRHSSSSYVLISTIQQLIVPRYHSHLTSLLKDEDDYALIGRLNFAEYTFCMEFENNPYTNIIHASVWPMYLKTNYVNLNTDDGKQNEVLIVKPAAMKFFDSRGNPRMNEEYKDKKVNEEIAVIHAYKSCKPFTVSNPQYDSIMIKRFLGQIR